MAECYKDKKQLTNMLPILDFARNVVTPFQKPTLSHSRLGRVSFSFLIQVVEPLSEVLILPQFTDFLLISCRLEQSQAMGPNPCSDGRQLNTFTQHYLKSLAESSSFFLDLVSGFCFSLTSITPLNPTFFILHPFREENESNSQQKKRGYKSSFLLESSFRFICF